MASLQVKNGSFYCQFTHDGRRHTVTVGRVSRVRAEAFATNVEDLLDHVRRGRVSIPAGVSVAEFVRSDGKARPRTAVSPAAPAITLGGVLDGYLAAVGGGALEASTVRTLELHVRHLKRLLGGDAEAAALARYRLQRYVNARVGESYHGRPIHPEPPRKELNTLRTAW
jgi:hypothetical protein